MNENPKIKLKLTIIDIVLEIFGWTSILLIWILIFKNYKSLPNVIPTHYNISGNADHFDKKSNILALPIIASILFIGIKLYLINFQTFLITLQK
ncbi:MAG: DUF1648 domain-containing protein [Bacteroidetes bacterium]|jgi:uncharacterized membrane protein|nr:DUF1648 domain-containing protein [Bacteroidota bacterium]